MGERTWESVLCLVIGHTWFHDSTWKLTNDVSHRAMWGDVCRRCNRFQPRSDGKQH